MGNAEEVQQEFAQRAEAIGLRARAMHDDGINGLAFLIDMEGYAIKVERPFSIRSKRVMIYPEKGWDFYTIEDGEVDVVCLNNVTIPRTSRERLPASYDFGVNHWNSVKGDYQKAKDLVDFVYEAEIKR